MLNFVLFLLYPEYWGFRITLIFVLCFFEFGYKIMPRIHNRQKIIVNLCRLTMFLWQASRKTMCNHKFSKKSMKIQILSYFVILFLEICIKSSWFWIISQQSLVRTFVLLPLILPCSSVPKSVQSRCKVGERPILNKSFTEFATEL